jgi:hypothetical protein
MIIKPYMSPIIVVFILNKSCGETPDFPGPPEMTSLCTEVADIHPFQELPFTALCTPDGMNLAVHQILE